MPKQGAQLLKVWDDWSAGAGYLKDDGRAPGYYTGSAILGAVGELRPAPVTTGVTLGNANAADKVAKYFFTEPSSSGNHHLYAVMVSQASPTGAISKVDLRNGTFAADQGTMLAPASPAKPLDTPAKYQGIWFVPQWDSTDTAKIQKLDTCRAGTIHGGTGTDDVWSEGAAGTGGSHLAMIGHQLSCVAYQLGVRILVADADPKVAANWGPFFEVGDLKAGVLAVAALQGLCFVPTTQGLHSFNAHGRAGLVFPDLEGWAAKLSTTTLTPHRGGLLLPDPNGLVWYQIGGLPVLVGPERRQGMLGSAPPGPTEWKGGLWHSVKALGEHVYGIYAPDPNSTSAYVMYGRATTPGVPQTTGWHVIGTTTLENINHMTGIFPAPQGKPESASYDTPTLWWGDDDELAYMILDADGSPFRARANTHKVALSGGIYLSELFFTFPTKLSHFVIYTQDMASGDEWQMKGIVNAGGDPGTGPVTANGRYEIPFDKEGVYRLMPHLTWTATATTARICPSVKRIELWGWPD